MHRGDAQSRYNKWWLGQFCRRAGSDGQYKLVMKVELIGPPSFVYGVVQLHYDDGTYDMISPGHAFKPRKIDVDVKPDLTKGGRG